MEGMGKPSTANQVHHKSHLLIPYDPGASNSDIEKKNRDKNLKNQHIVLEIPHGISKLCRLSSSLYTNRRYYALKKRKLRKQRQKRKLLLDLVWVI